jgi:hypothetical protein
MRNRSKLLNTYIIIAIALLCLTMQISPLFAQKASATLDTTSIRIGEQVQLKLDVTLPKGVKISWPQFSDTIFAPVEIVRRSKVDTLETTRNNYLQYKQVLSVTSFDTGYHTIPQIAFSFQAVGDDSIQTTITDSLILHVRTVEVDTTRAIKDIKAPMQAPISLSELWPVFATFAVIGLIAGFIWYYLWRRKMKKPLFPVIRKPQLPPWQTALESLSDIESRKLWQAGRIKEFYTEITDVLRIYLEKQHNIPAMEMISSDIVESLDGVDIFKSSKDKIWQVLQLADLVKFAKEKPLPNEHEISIANARNFVLETKPVETDKKPSSTQDETSNI